MKQQIFHFGFASESFFWRAPIKDATRWWGSDFQKKLDSSTGFEEIDTDKGTGFAYPGCCFSVSAGWSRLGHKSIQSRILPFFVEFLFTRVLNTKGLQLVKESFLEKIYVHRIDIFQSFAACTQMPFQIEYFIEKSALIRATKGCEDCVNVAHVTYKIFYLNSLTVSSCFCTLRRTSSSIMFPYTKSIT